TERALSGVTAAHLSTPSAPIKAERTQASIGRPATSTKASAGTGSPANDPLLSLPAKMTTWTGSIAICMLLHIRKLSKMPTRCLTAWQVDRFHTFHDTLCRKFIFEKGEKGGAAAAHFGNGCAACS